MPLLNISLITKTLITLLELRLPHYAEWPGSATLVASPAPPDVVAGDYTLSLYLYHLKEDAHTKSQDWQVSEATPLRYRPMGLTLNYVLCPRSSASSIDDRTYNDQLLMGLALKTLHDYPLIDDTTVVETAGPPKLVMPAALRGKGNRLRIELRPTPVEEAGQYWQAGTQAARLAAYYEVSATLLEPEQPQSRRSRVLSVGVHTFTRGAPVIDRTRSRIHFTLPEESSPRLLELTPAEAAAGQQFEILGADLKGDRTTLLLTHRDFIEPLAVDAAWDLSTDGSCLQATVRASAGGQALLPGIYGCLVRTTMRRTLPDGSQRDFDADSNEYPLAISPRIGDVQFPAGLGTMTLEGFDPAAVNGAELQLYLGSQRLTRVNGAPAAGQFQAASPDTILFRCPAGVVSGSILPLRLIVRAAESAPGWVVVP